MYVLSTLVFEVLWEALALPPMPGRIAVDQHGKDEEERRGYLRQAGEQVARQRLGSVREVKPALAELLELLATHDRALGWRELVGQRRRAYLAERGQTGVVAIVEGERIQISRQRANFLVPGLLHLLPPMPAGNGRAVSVPTETYQHAIQLAVDGKGTMEQRRLLRKAGVRGDQAEQLELLGRTTINTGAISVHRGKRGEVKLTGSLAYTDTSHGRYVILQRPDRSGVSYTSIMPADGKVLQRHVADLLGTAVAW